MSSRPPEQPSLRLYVLDAGLIELEDYAMFSPSAGPDTHYEMPVRCFVIVHPRGTLVWDTGIEDAINGEPGGRRIMDPVRFHVPRTVRGQLEQIEVDPAAVDYVGLSHMHVDHVGNAGLFSAPILLQRAEHDAAFSSSAEELTYEPEAYAAIDRDRFRTIEGEHDVFGDGSVVTVPLPGHTPGHQGLLVRLPQTGAVLLAGDVSYSLRDYLAGRVRDGNVDLEASARSMNAAKRLEAEGALVWLHHDAAAQRAIRRAPDFYG